MQAEPSASSRPASRSRSSRNCITGIRRLCSRPSSKPIRPNRRGRPASVPARSEVPSSAGRGAGQERMSRSQVPAICGTPISGMTAIGLALGWQHHEPRPGRALPELAVEAGEVADIVRGGEHQPVEAVLTHQPLGTCRAAGELGRAEAPLRQGHWPLPRARSGQGFSSGRPITRVRPGLRQDRGQRPDHVHVPAQGRVVVQPHGELDRRHDRRGRHIAEAVVRHPGDVDHVGDPAARPDMHRRPP